jgi:transcriptional regulator with XRE-family HTH domain
MVIKKLRELKEKSGLTVQQISDKSGVQVSTISRIMSGQTDNPGFQTVCDLVEAMGGSLYDLTGQAPPAPQEEHHSAPVGHDCLHGERQHCCTIVMLYERSLEHKNRWIKNLFIACGAMLATIILVLLIDILNGGIGFVRY